jgi:hypothetical protein
VSHAPDCCVRRAILIGDGERHPDHGVVRVWMVE